MKFKVENNEFVAGIETEGSSIDWDTLIEYQGELYTGKAHKLSDTELFEYQVFEHMVRLHEQYDGEPLVAIQYPDPESTKYFTLSFANGINYLERPKDINNLSGSVNLYLPLSELKAFLDTQASSAEAGQEESELYFSIFGTKNGIKETLFTGECNLSADENSILASVQEQAGEELMSYLKKHLELAEKIRDLGHETQEFKTEASELIMEYQNIRKNINGEKAKTHVQPRRYGLDANGSLTRLFHGKTVDEFEPKQNEEKEKEAMSIKVTASKVNLVKREGSNLKAICEIELNEIIQLKGIRVLEGQNGLFVSYPAYKPNTPDLEHPYQEYMYFADKDIKETVSKQILRAYKMEIHQRQFEHKISVRCTPLPDAGSTKALAMVSIDEMRIGNVRIMEGKGGLFVVYPSVPDTNSKTGYTDIVVPVKYVRDQINEAVLNAYKAQKKEVRQEKQAEKQGNKPRVPKL